MSYQFKLWYCVNSHVNTIQTFNVAENKLKVLKVPFLGCHLAFIVQNVIITDGRKVTQN